jgi:peptidoglycan/xylan/chitin deacetylase (PgdA/CDA1 family)
LTYHRVLPARHPELAMEQPGMYVTPGTLDMHLTQLRKHLELVHLDDWLRRAATGQRLPSQSCALTFDDGWRDNFEYAFPILQRHQVPATIFLVSGMIDTDREFWPNRLARLLAMLAPGQTLPGRLGVLLGWHGRHEPDSWDPETIDQVIAVAKELDEAQVDALLDEFPAARRTAADGPALLDDAQLRTMAKSGLVRFGSHTRTHVRLTAKLAPEALEEQIAASYADIVARLPEAAAPIFCYPNGDTSEASVAVVRKHYIGAVTTRAGWHTCGADPFTMRRFGVHEDISKHPAGFLARVSGWT